MATLSHDMYPHIVQAIAKAASWEVKLAFRLTSKYYLDKIDRDIFSHVDVWRRPSKRLSGYPDNLNVGAYDRQWPVEDVILVGVDRKELPVYPRESCSRWIAVLSYIRTMDLYLAAEYVTDSLMILLHAPAWKGPGTRWELPVVSEVACFRHKCGVPLTVWDTLEAVINPIDMQSEEGDEEVWNESSISTPRNVEFNPNGTINHKDGMPSLSPARIVTMCSDPFYRRSHDRRLVLRQVSTRRRLDTDTRRWVFVSAPNVNASDRRQINEPPTLEESFLWTIVENIAYTSYNHYSLVGVESTPST